MKILLHYTTDWCHLCGERTTPLADIWYPNNAEHVLLGLVPEYERENYIRICASCGELIARVGAASAS